MEPMDRFAALIYTQTGATLCAQSLGGIDRVVSVARDADAGSGDAEPPAAEPGI